MTDTQHAEIMERLAEIRDALKQRPQATHPAPRAAQSTGAPVSSAGGDASRGSFAVKFGRDKGQAIDAVADLSWYRAAIAQSVGDPSKDQWRTRNLDDLAAIDAEIARRSGGGQAPSESNGAPPDASDDDIPF